jgi:aspartate carbamoyltransferase regulatory subunit
MDQIKVQGEADLKIKKGSIIYIESKQNLEVYTVINLFNEDKSIKIDVIVTDKHNGFYECIALSKHKVENRLVLTKLF